MVRPLPIGEQNPFDVVDLTLLMQTSANKTCVIAELFKVDTPKYCLLILTIFTRRLREYDT